MKPFKFVETKVPTIPRDEYPDINSVIDKYDGYNDDGDFYDFSDGVPLSNKEKQRFIDECLDYLSENPDERFCSIGTGNTRVIAIRYEDEIQVLVTSNYMEANIFL